ncbi:MAG: diadenylate cyclase CdaA [Clostridia bacterium]|nr:diadenylate cyclase CdaA [Clostridia bacterium]
MTEAIGKFFSAVWSFIGSIEWYDIADIVLVTFIIYYCIKLIRQTRAFHLVKGIVLVAIAFFVVSALNMSTASYLFSRVFSDIVIVLLLLFQPEIRQVVESVGRGDFKRYLKLLVRSKDEANDELHNSISNISKAVANMSDKKIGALIVIEGTVLLEDVVSSGARVDSAVSVPVIENIFFPKAPLHDGAMVIRDNRIHSAGCILPLTQSDLSLELGTRHRAGVGMSENSDAMIIIVSEETGKISVAQSGELMRGISLGELLAALTDFLIADEEEKGKKKIIRRRKK